MNFYDTSRHATVLGAGMVGVSCALALQAKGWRVTLVDKREPGEETSGGNAGVLSRSSLLPFNRPGLWRSLPQMLLQPGPGLKVRASALSNWPWLWRFLWHANRTSFEKTTVALDALIQLSWVTHRTWLTQAQSQHLLRENGWLWLYQNPSSFDASEFTREVLQKFSVATEILSPQSLHELEPHLAPHYSHALWIKDAASVTHPEGVVKAYAQQFINAGGIIQKEEIKAIAQHPNGWQWQSSNGDSHATPNLVVAMGPWSEKLLGPFKFQNQSNTRSNAPSEKTSSLRIKMGFERGYHRQFKPVEGVPLGRPIYDISGAYVLSPMQNAAGKNIMRLTTGVELAAQDAQPNWQQLEDAENAARRAFPMKEALPSSDWMGSRPSLPDSRPVIGEMPGCPGLWLAFGHQHIGFSTGPGTGVLLAELMSSESTSIDPRAFAVDRF